jgi:hypothetical protein
MAIIITNKIFSKCKINWIYLGENISQLASFENSNFGKRISIKKYIDQESILISEDIIKWINKQRLLNEDSIHWLMSNIAGRNNLGNRFFDDLLRISAMIKWINDNENNFKDSDIIIYCEDSFIFKTLFNNIHSSKYLEFKYSSLKYFKEIFILVIKSSLLLARQLYIYLKDYIWARKSLGKKKKHYPINKIYIVHQCLDNSAFSKNAKVSCRYFTKLPDWIENQGHIVYRLPWFNNVTIPKKEVFNKLRTSNFFIPEDWLSFFDYCRSLKDSYELVYKTKSEKYFINLDIKSLLNRELYYNILSAPSKSQFFRYKYAFSNFSKNLKEVTFINFFEMTIPEFVPLITWKKNIIQFKSIGYYHSLVSNDNLCFYFDKNEINSNCYPNIIVTNGNISRDILLSRGFDEKRVVLGPALRQNREIIFNKISDNAIMLLLSIDLNATTELINSILSIKEWINKELNVTVYLKPHPMLTKNKILKNINNDIPSYWKWFDGEIKDAFALSRCCISIATASIYDVLLSEKISIALTRELTTNWNYSDILEKQFNSLNAISLANLKNRLYDIYLGNPEKYDAEAKIIRNTLISGLNPITDELLNAFI